MSGLEKPSNNSMKRKKYKSVHLLMKLNIDFMITFMIFYYGLYLPFYSSS